MICKTHDDFLEQKIELFFESNGLSKDEIALRNDVSRLEYNLRFINEIITKPDKIGQLSIGDREIDITPFLLQRKKIVIDRINELSANEKMENLQGLVEQLTEGDIKTNLKRELTELQHEASKYKEELRDITTRETEAKIKFEQQRIDSFERKSKIWLSFLQRESAASLIGAIVLLLLTLALIFGKESQILSNGFLVILGYFFGQSSTRTCQDNDRPAGTRDVPEMFDH